MMERRKLLTILSVAGIIAGGLGVAGIVLRWDDIRIARDAARDGDMDGDGIPTKRERELGMNPLIDDTRDDLDGDGLMNIADLESSGLNPNDWDVDRDGLPDGYDPDPTTPNTPIHLSDQFLPGLKEAVVRTDVSSLVSYTKRWDFREDEPPAFTKGGSYDSPAADEWIAEHMHPIPRGIPWRYTHDTYELSGQRNVIAMHTTEPTYRPGIGHFVIRHDAVRQPFESQVTNTRAEPLNDSRGQPYQYAIFDYDAPGPAGTLLDIRGTTETTSPVELEIRLYPNSVLDPTNKVSFAVPTTDLTRGAFAAAFVIPEETPAGKLVIIPTESLPGGAVQAPDDGVVDLRYVKARAPLASYHQTVSNETTLLTHDPSPATGVIVDARSGETSWLLETEAKAMAVQRVTTVIDALVDLHVLPDASIDLKAEFDDLAERRIPGVRAVVVLKDTEGRYTVTTTSAGFVELNGKTRWVTRATEETFKELPREYAQYEQGILKKAATTAAFASEVTGNGAKVGQSVILEDTKSIRAAMTAIEDTIRAGYVATEDGKKWMKPGTAFRIVGGGLAVLSAAHAYHALDAAINADEAAAPLAWAEFTVASIAAASFLFPPDILLLAGGALVTIVIESMIDGTLSALASEAIDYVASVLDDTIPKAYHDDAWRAAVNDLSPKAAAANAPLYVGQDVDGDGDPEAGPVGPDGGFVMLGEKTPGIGLAAALAVLALAAILGTRKVARRR